MKTRLFLAAAAVAVLSAIAGCATTGGLQPPTQTQVQSVVTNTLGLAVIVEVSKGTTDPAVMKERATKIKAIAVQLQALDQGAVSSLPLLAQTVIPLVTAANLGPTAVPIAMALLSTLNLLVQQYTAAGGATVTTTIQAALAAVVTACNGYGA